MKKLTRLAIAGVVAFGLTGMTVPAAHADTPGCVSKQEFRKVKDGFKKRRVHRIFDTRGRQTSIFRVGGETYESREYKPCSDRKYGFVWVDYVNGRLDAKYAYWG